MIPKPYFLKSSNSVEAPRASPIAIPITEAIPLDSLSESCNS